MIVKWWMRQVGKRPGQRRAESARKRATKQRPTLGNTATWTGSRKQVPYHGEDVLHKNAMKNLEAPILQVK